MAISKSSRETHFKLKSSQNQLYFDEKSHMLAMFFMKSKENFENSFENFSSFESLIKNPHKMLLILYE